ncbi:hypothetical protein [Actinocorallia sp. A-T 12471]|uniref:hypothetical protein n=1 Tax=Actinocorallia sp. A-T 12471 TaxID=3089813 RepID=UPI0029CD6307|nr:hypothetical protein [Actinocorallia sp. A-T 12471]MDX6742469.1 hypothetical protein [Actinocorallia sp. A-T 12471]
MPPMRARMPSTGRTTPQGAALAWLGHPVTLLAVVVLAVNDHLLKPAFTGLLTGKLSDFAGLVFAPALLAVALAALGWAGERAAALSVLATGVGFALVKTTSVGAAGASAVWSAVSGPSVILADPGDLLALPALAVSWAVHVRTRGSGPGARWVRFVRVLVVVPLAVLATAATSAPAERSVRDVWVEDGRLFFSEGYDFASRDGGLTWERIDPEPVPTTPSPTPTYATPTPPSPPATPLPPVPEVPYGQPSACLPSQPTHCYRVVPGRLAVQETDDGRTWRTAWEVSEGRTDFLRRQSFNRGLDPRIESIGLAVQEVAGGHVVLVANGGDGLTLRNAQGEWHRAGFPKIVDGRVAPMAEWRVPDATDVGAYGTRAVYTGLLVFALALGAGLLSGRALYWGVPLTVLGAALGLTLNSMDLLVLLAGPLSIVMLIIGVVLLLVAASTFPDGRRVLSCGGVAVLSALLAPLPLVVWASGALDGLRIAALLTILLAAAGVATSYLVGRAVALR